MITIVDYGAGNLHSVSNALRSLGHTAQVTSDPRVIAEARALILPGVGSAQQAMDQLERLDLVEPLRAYVRSGRPFLGVCLGLQLLFTESEEGGGRHCLDLIPGVVRRLPVGVKVPHMGWNSVRIRWPHPVLEGIPSDSHFYFVHSFVVEPSDPSVILGETEHGVPFPSVVAMDNVVATQFHPEKSSRMGLRIYDNFARLAVGESVPAAATVAAGRGGLVEAPPSPRV